MDASVVVCRVDEGDFEGSEGEIEGDFEDVEGDFEAVEVRDRIETMMMVVLVLVH